MVVRELSECQFWLGFIVTRGWIDQERLQPLAEECRTLRKIFGSMIARVRRNDREAESQG